MVSVDKTGCFWKFFIYILFATSYRLLYDVRLKSWSNIHITFL